MPSQHKRNPKPPPNQSGRPTASKNKKPKSPISRGSQTSAEIMFAKLYAIGLLSGQECARQAGLSTGTVQGTATRVRRLSRDTRIRADINRFRRAAATAAGIDIAILAEDFVNRVRADRTAIYNEDGSIKSPKQWPEVLRMHRRQETQVR